MAIKSTKKIKERELSEDEKEELEVEGELPKGEIIESENKQLIWFFVVVGLIFAAFLIPYFWAQNSKTFEWGGAEWLIEDDVYLDQLYHGRFMALDGGNFFYNVWLRNDPRVDNVYTEGSFDSFKYGGYLARTRDIQNCKGEIPRAMVDLESFVKVGIGVGVVESSSAEVELAEEFNYTYVDCSIDLNRTVIILKMGEPSVVQDHANPNCYIITIKDCEDNQPIEKFITKTIHDFNLMYNV